MIVFEECYICMIETSVELLKNNLKNFLLVSTRGSPSWMNSIRPLEEEIQRRLENQTTHLSERRSPNLYFSNLHIQKKHSAPISQNSLGYFVSFLSALLRATLFHLWIIYKFCGVFPVFGHFTPCSPNPRLKKEVDLDQGRQG